MTFALQFTAQAEADYKSLAENASRLKRFKAVRKALGYLETNPGHPGLNTHKYSALVGPDGLPAGFDCLRVVTLHQGRIRGARTKHGTACAEKSLKSRLIANQARCEKKKDTSTCLRYLRRREQWN